MKWICSLLFVLTTVGCASAKEYKIVRRGGVVSSTPTPWPDISTWQAHNPKPGDRALIVAIEEYAFLPPVLGAVRNANDWQAYFESRDVSVTVLHNRDATREKILDALKQDSAVERFWFVFIGHGAPTVEGDDGVLVGMDTQQNIDSIFSRGVRRSQVLENAPGDSQVVILDTCFSGRDPKGDLLADGVQPVVPVIDAVPTATVLTAAAGDQFSGSLPGLERPAFSYLVLGALRGWANNGDGEVTAKEAVQFAARHLRNASGRTQTPSILGPDVALDSGTEPEPNLKDALIAANDSKEKVYIDTGEGVMFERPAPQWRLASYNMPGMLYKKAVIHFQHENGAYLVVQKIGSMAVAGLGETVEFTAEPYRKTVAGHTGTYAEWRVVTQVESGEVESRAIGFTTAHDGQPWKFSVRTAALSEQELEIARNALLDLVGSIEFN